MSKKLEKLEFQLEKIIGILKHPGKVRKWLILEVPRLHQSCEEFYSSESLKENIKQVPTYSSLWMQLQG